jgi:hypothetical protein
MAKMVKKVSSLHKQVHLSSKQAHLMQMPVKRQGTMDGYMFDYG